MSSEGLEKSNESVRGKYNTRQPCSALVSSAFNAAILSALRCMTSNIIGEFGRLRIAEVPAMGTWLQDKSIAETRLRQVAGVNIVGLWQEGQFQLPS